MQIKQEKLNFSDVDDTDEESDGQTTSTGRQALEIVKARIKQEKITSSEDDSDSSQSPMPTALAARVKSEPPERDSIPSNRSSIGAVPVKIEPSEKRPRGNDKGVEPLGEDEHPSNNTSTLVKGTGFPPQLQSKLVDYLQRFPNIRTTTVTSGKGPAVELDLSNPDEEAWIVQCPASIDPHVVLLNRKLNLSASQATVKKCPVPLETTVRRNTTQQIISVVAESQMKSFVPAGFIRITEPLPEVGHSEQLDKEEYCEVRVPFPDDIRERHPLLGYDFQTLLAIPNRVQKRLSIARQKADLFYTSPQPAPLEKTNHNNSSTNSESHTEPTAKPKKRKAAHENVATKLPTETVPADKIAVKEEPMTPTKKKVKKEATIATEDAGGRSVVVKEEVTEATEDDISWLLNI
uniref:Uncharacterized protein n=1 Tax=Anopheles triannulatus TaxID=58253 RepID=A0A2M4AN51_9DIPT